MMKTLFSWLIANVETITNILVILVFEIVVFSGKLGISNDDLVLYVFLCPLVLLIAKSLSGSYPSKSTMVDFFNLTMFLFSSVIIIFIAQESRALFVITFIVSLIAGVIAAIFAFNNIAEVSSKRMFYINSNVDMFSYSLKYSFNRFVSVFASLANTVYILAIVQFVSESLIIKQ